MAGRRGDEAQRPQDEKRGGAAKSTCGHGPSVSTIGTSRQGSSASLPGEHRLLDVVDSLARVAEQSHLLELVEDRSRRRVDQVVPERHLKHGAVALRDLDEARL